MDIQIINREDDPEEFARVEELFKKIRECEMRGHGELFVDSDGLVSCRDCEQGLLAGPDDWPGYIDPENETGSDR